MPDLPHSSAGCPHDDSIGTSGAVRVESHRSSLLPHHAYTRLADGLRCDRVDLEGKRGPALLSVGSGLLMASYDMLSLSMAAPHCAVDVGRAPVDEMARLIDYAAHVEGHVAVVVHTWQSRSSAAALADVLTRQYPHLVAGDCPVPVLFRLRGLGDETIPEGFPNCQTWQDLEKAVQAIFCPERLSA